MKKRVLILSGVICLILGGFTLKSEVVEAQAPPPGVHEFHTTPGPGGNWAFCDGEGTDCNNEGSWWLPDNNQ